MVRPVLVNQLIKTTLGMEKADGGCKTLVLNHTMPNRYILGSVAIWPNRMLYTRTLSGQENLEFLVS